MASSTRVRPTLVGVLAGVMLATSAQAQAQAPAAPPAAEQDATTVTDITVIGGRVAPTTENPKSATCEFLVATDPFVRAQIEAAAGDPMMGPRFYQPTRFPRNVNMTAAPTSEAGSALPNIGRQFRGVTTRRADGADSTAGQSERRLYNSSVPGRPASTRVFDAEDATLSPPEFTRDNAIDTCRGLYSAGGSAGVSDRGGRSEISYSDKTLPTAMALFDEGRYPESLDYFHRAFKKLAYEYGGDEAALMIGKLHLGAPGIPTDMKEAMVWLNKAGGARFNAVTDMPIFDPLEPGRNTAIGEASMILARIYQTGFGGAPKDPAKARKWFERAFYVGHVPAAMILGDMYYFGSDAPKDSREAFSQYKKAATLGYAPAQYALGEMYLNGEAAGGRNLKMGLAWHNEAAKIGFAGSLFVLAVHYETGEGVPADPQRALGLYKLAALSGSAPAQNAIGTYFYDGRMLAKDQAIARRWFERAAIDGDSDAMFNLGAMMMKGEGGQVDRTRAWVWLKIAERVEHPNAHAAVSVLEARMTAEEKAAAAKLLAPTNS